jgi:hypothetical protein
MEYGTKVNVIDWFGRPRNGTVVSRPNSSGYLWVRIEENLLPGFTGYARAVMKQIYNLECMPKFSTYQAWLHESACTVVQ